MFDKVLNTPLYLLTPEVYLGICEKSMMELFTSSFKVINKGIVLCTACAELIECTINIFLYVG